MPHTVQLFHISFQIHNVTAFDGEDCIAVVITEGSQIGAVDYSMKIIKIIEKIDSLFKNFHRDSRRFSVDYDQTTGGIYCNYTPYPNDNGFAVSKDLLIIDETSQADLKRLKDWLDKNGIYSRSGCEWDWICGWNCFLWEYFTRCHYPKWLIF